MDFPLPDRRRRQRVQQGMELCDGTKSRPVPGGKGEIEIAPPIGAPGDEQCAQSPDARPCFKLCHINFRAAFSVNVVSDVYLPVFCLFFQMLVSFNNLFQSLPAFQPGKHLLSGARVQVVAYQLVIALPENTQCDLPFRL